MSKQGNLKSILNLKSLERKKEDSPSIIPDTSTYKELHKSKQTLPETTGLVWFRKRDIYMLTVCSAVKDDHAQGQTI